MMQKSVMKINSVGLSVTKIILEICLISQTDNRRKVSPIYTF